MDALKQFGDFYLAILVPVFATLAFYFTTRREVLDWIRNRPRATVRMEGARLCVRNRSPFPIFIARCCYIADDFRPRNLSIELLDQSHSAKVERAGQYQVLVQTENKAYGIHGYSGCAARPMGFAVQLQSGEYFTTLPSWNLPARVIFSLKNRP